MAILEAPQRIEPARIEEPSEAISDVVAELSAERSDKLKPKAVRLLEEALIRGQFERGDTARVTGLPERTARRALNDVIVAGLLASDTPKGAVSLRFPADALEILFPRLFPET